MHIFLVFEGDYEPTLEGVYTNQIAAETHRQYLLDERHKWSEGTNLSDDVTIYEVVPLESFTVTFNQHGILNQPWLID